jgi:superfamily II DNA or RNA helicase
MSVKIVKINEVYSQIQCADDLLYQLVDEYAKFVEGYKYMPLYKKGRWDGKVRYINRSNGFVYNGLLSRVVASCNRYGEGDIDLIGHEYTFKSDITKDYIDKFIDNLNLPYELYSYQYLAITECLINKRRTILSATSSGKSLVIYCIARILAEFDEKLLITVGTNMLLNQLIDNFKEYSQYNNFDFDANVHIVKGDTKHNDKLISFTTWQNVNGLKPKKGEPPSSDYADFMETFTGILTDEVHEATADSLKYLMENAVNAQYRMGLTGSLDSKVSRESIVGLYGKVVKVKDARSLIDEGKATAVQVKAIELDYPLEIRKLVSDMTYIEEVDTIIGCEYRNKLISAIASSEKGNGIIITRFIDKHAVVLKEILEGMTDKKVILLDKDSSEELKAETRHLLETIDNAIIIATYKLVSTGVSINNLHYIILALGIKRENAILQAIGRLLRLHSSKSMTTFYDFGDNLEYDLKANHMLRHYLMRLAYYNKEGHEIIFKKIKVKYEQEQ